MDTIRNYTASRQNKSVAEEPVTSVLPDGEVPVFDRELNADEQVLAALGYKPEFKREFSLWTTFSVSFAVLGLLPSFASTLYYVSLRWGASGLETELIILTGNGLCWDSWDGLGMAHRHDLHSMRKHEYGRNLLLNAYERRFVLCSCSSCS